VSSVRLFHVWFHGSTEHFTGFPVSDECPSTGVIESLISTVFSASTSWSGLSRCKNYYYYSFIFRIILGSYRRPETKQGIEGKLLGSYREGLGIGLGIGLGLGIRIADLNQIADLKLSILAPFKFRSPI